MPTYVGEESVDVDTIIGNGYRDVFLMASKIRYKLGATKELMDLVRVTVAEPSGTTHVDMGKHINYFEYVNKLIVEVDALLLVTKQARRLKKYNVEAVMDMIKMGVTNTDGSKHDEIKLFMCSFLIYQLVADIHWDILRMKSSDAWSYMPESVDTINASTILALQNVCDGIFKMMETRLCELLNITKFDPIIEETLGIRLDEIYDTISDFMSKS